MRTCICINDAEIQTFHSCLPPSVNFWKHKNIILPSKCLPPLYSIAIKTWIRILCLAVVVILWKIMINCIMPALQHTRKGCGHYSPSILWEVHIFVGWVDLGTKNRSLMLKCSREYNSIVCTKLLITLYKYKIQSISVIKQFAVGVRDFFV